MHIYIYCLRNNSIFPITKCTCVCVFYIRVQFVVSCRETKTNLGIKKIKTFRKLKSNLKFPSLPAAHCYTINVFCNIIIITRGNKNFSKFILKFSIIENKTKNNLSRKCICACIKSIHKYVNFFVGMCVRVAFYCNL